MVKKTTLAIDFKKAKEVAYRKIASNDDIGLYILLCLETGLRISDALAITKNNFFNNGKEYFIKFTSQKTKKEAKRPISKILFDKVMDKNQDLIFINEKSKKVYSKMWVGRKLKVSFLNECKEARREGKTISSHSLRKSAGQLVYQVHGIEAARDFLQHETYQTTKDYLNIGERKLNQLLKDTLID